MRSNIDEEERIEQMIEDCLDAIDADSDRFTAWEITFLESIEDQNYFQHMTETQIQKLEEIWETKVQLD